MGGGRGEGAKAEEGRRNNERIPNWCGSVGWLLSSKPKGHQFDSWSEHMPGFWARSLVGGLREATDPCFSLISMSEKDRKGERKPENQREKLSLEPAHLSLLMPVPPEV